MKIQRIHIRNFRALQDLQVDFENVTTFIGPNGTGKSTILHALDWFFNGSTKGSLTDQDCSHGSSDQPIEVRVTFGGLTADDRVSLGEKYAPADASTFSAWKTRTPDGEERLSANAKGYPGFNGIKSQASAASMKDAYKKLREQEPDLGLPAVRSRQDVEEAMTSWEARNPDRLEDVVESLTTNFFGFNSNAKMSSLFKYVLVKADLRASEESVDTKNSLIGKILERAIDRSAADEEIESIVAQAQQAQQRAYDSQFKEGLSNVSSELNQIVDSYSPGRRITVRPSDLDLRVPNTTFEVAIMDGETETPVERQGHGFQRTLLIAALQLLSRSSAAGATGVVCIAIEEPELFQHPTQAQAFAKVLRQLADDESQKIQVTYATHSPYFVEARRFSEVRRLSRTGRSNQAVMLNSSTVDTVIDALKNTLKADNVRRRVAGTIESRLQAALFADRVLLVEGVTDSAVVYGIADRRSSGLLETRGVSVVDVQGKDNIALSHAILQSLGIDTFVMFDGDGNFESRPAAKQKSGEKIEELRRETSSKNRKLLAYFDLEPVGFPEETETGRLLVLKNDLEDLLHHSWEEWSLSIADLESASGMKIGKNHDAYRTATHEAAGNPPDVLVRLVDRLLE